MSELSGGAAAVAVVSGAAPYPRPLAQQSGSYSTRHTPRHPAVTARRYAVMTHVPAMSAALAVAEPAASRLPLSLSCGLAPIIPLYH
ncbi:hypothetical protein E2562_001794 [Oryza meyeriana var. granulata]|uniref:Uncharacterized protein n=1 Tax=Oryza meyeriana var. granulata TaxID=110450 RepID=A0A6G1CDC0_9ORYZ|nr:hypothetical protein E2562_001794 [Oryza meyeriana var. granulata]